MILPTPISHNGMLPPKLLAAMTPVAVASDMAFANFGVRSCIFCMAEFKRISNSFLFISLITQLFLEFFNQPQNI